MAKNGNTPKEPNLLTPDGRISPDKAIAFVRDLMRDMTPEQVQEIASRPVVLKGYKPKQ